MFTKPNLWKGHTVYAFSPIIFVFLLSLASPPLSAQGTSDNLIDRRIEGLLIGSLIGDAAGGPVEFMAPKQVRHLMPATRTWPDEKKLTHTVIKKLSDSFPLLPYTELRPEPEPYAHWTADAPAGTITDDSRHKIILLNTLRYAQQRKTFPVTQRDLAREYLAFASRPAMQSRPHYAALCRENLHEFYKSAHWILGERDLNKALPPERLWAGVPTCAGQMVLLPLAALYSGQPKLAYRAAYQLGFIDNGSAKDLNAALVAGLAKALNMEIQSNMVHAAWQHIIKSMKDEDPYQYNQIPWVTRPIKRWLDFAHSAVQRADKRPKHLFKILETEASPHYWWDAHFLIAASFAFLEICDFDPLAAMHLALDFGHDTDSAAQLIGAFAGALHGPDIFPKAMRRQVSDRLQLDYGESLQEWVELLASLPKGRDISQIIKLD